jgi:hypothetical protein
MARPAKLTPQAVSDTEIRLISTHLSDRCGFGSHRDASLILQRIVALTTAGESATSIMRRLNPPAIIEQTASPLMDPAKIIPAAYAIKPTPIRPMATPERTPPPLYHRLWCSACGTIWKREKARGRKPTVCPDCKPPKTNQENT